jgi:hypothetical protein
LDKGEPRRVFEDDSGEKIIKYCTTGIAYITIYAIRTYSILCNSIGLRMVIDTEKLKQIGSEWIKNDIHRIYFNNIFDLLEAEITYHKTGTFDNVKINGQRISNNDANSIKMSAKVWYDVKTGEFDYKNLDKIYFDQIVDEIKSKVEAMPEVKVKSEYEMFLETMAKQFESREIEYKILENGSIEATYKGVIKLQTKEQLEPVFNQWKTQRK